MTQHTKASILELLHSNKRAVERALVVLHDRQTADERSQRTTKHSNRVGFNSADAYQFSRKAERIKAGYRLSEGEFYFLTQPLRGRYPSRIGKYASQLLAIAAEKERLNDAQMVRDRPSRRMNR